MEKSSNVNTLDRCFEFIRDSRQKCSFSFDDFSLITGPKTTNFIYLERRSYILLKYIKIVIVVSEITTLLERS